MPCGAKTLLPWIAGTVLSFKTLDHWPFTKQRMSRCDVKDGPAEEEGLYSQLVSGSEGPVRVGNVSCYQQRFQI